MEHLTNVGRIWLVRHAPVAVRGICYGQSDVPTKLGVRSSVRRIAAALSRHGLRRCDEVWSSPWTRTQSVAAALGARWDAPVRIDARLSELSFGEWEGRTYDALQATDSDRFEAWMSAFETVAPPGGETATELVERMRAWLEARRSSAASVLAVTHAGAIRAARSLRRGVGYGTIAIEPVEYLLPEEA